MKFKNSLFLMLGFLLLFIGAFGVFIPVLPTTPFILVAAGCFSSNKRLSNWLIKSQLFGEYITNYRERKGLSKKTVIRSLSFLWTMLTISVICIHSLWAIILMPCIGVAVTIHIVMIAKPKGEAKK